MRAANGPQPSLSGLGVPTHISAWLRVETPMTWCRLVPICRAFRRILEVFRVRRNIIAALSPKIEFFRFTSPKVLGLVQCVMQPGRAAFLGADDQ